MQERDAVFRERLVAVVGALNKGESRDATLRRVIGGYAYALARQTGARSWADLKQRVDAPGYDALLKRFELDSAGYQKKGDTMSVRALEALALSLIARYQTQNDLVPGVGFLDRFIESCVSAVRPPAKKVVVTARSVR
jgi:hypothetical protein